MRQLVAALALSFLCSCTSSRQAITQLPTPEPVDRVVVKTVETKRPAPIVPAVDPLKMRTVTWSVVTPDNIDAKFAALNGDKVLFALTADGYQNMALNLADVRASIQQYNQIIETYKKSYR